MSVPQDQNVSRKECEKRSHYKSLQIEIAKMWKRCTTIIPVVIGALGMIKKGSEKYIKQLPGDSNLRELQKITLMDLQIEITNIWKLNTTIMPVVIGALGMIKKGAEKYIKQLPGNSNLRELQKITLMGTAHLLRKAISI
uniref:Uncharacterized protein n=1 Tax=Octopus bimaculoides TaxID=37653 RepID=A0A0L8HMU9_OCTBM